MTTHTDDFSPSHTPGKAFHVSLWAVQGLLALFFGFTGVIKVITPHAELAAQMPWVSAVPVFVPLIAGAAEIAAAIGLLFPALFRIKPQLTPLAAVGLVLIMLPAAVLHLSRGEFEMLPINLILGGLAAFVAWGRMKRVPIASR